MKKLFWGFFFIFFDFYLSLNQYTLHIFPDFVGYLLLLQGTKELAAESRCFKNIQPFTVGMTVYTAILWTGALLGVGAGSVYHQPLTSILELISVIVALYINWVLVQGVLEMEASRSAELNGGTLYKRWKGMAAFQAARWLLGLLADLANVAVLASLAVLLAIASAVLTVLYLIAWWRAAKAWEDLPPQNTGDAEPK